ncbi:MAG: type I-E CRISPR-associated protein Cas6/Cse3/CasE [Dehalococcoidia bacterium]|nr:type I-E CRISPR-associated protein Cas6/Cse3/CasE [Dehalococcoidia bacterium]
MSGLHLVRLPIRLPPLLRFSRERGIPLEDDDLGYLLHAWLTALFAGVAPKPFRYFARRGELLGYARESAEELLERAKACGDPLAWSALEVDGVASKPMPERWRCGQRLWIEALVCPTSRRGGEEKDIYLRAIDRGVVPGRSRGELYREWFIARCQPALDLERVELLGMRARCRLIRRSRRQGSRLRVVERPTALFGASARIRDAASFASLLARGIGRHRAFGFGMLLLAPPR